MNFKTENIVWQSSSLQGKITAAYSELVKVFGEPNAGNDGYKTDAEWELEFKNGTYATIYNWKDGKNYCGESGLDISEITDWHIGGNVHAAYELVRKTIKEYRTTKK
jgi:hypothetical protein